MTANQPIDYARAESADVVRKKHRRRVFWFVVVTVVVMAIAIRWSIASPPWWYSAKSPIGRPFTIVSTDDNCVLFFGLELTEPTLSDWRHVSSVRNEKLGVGISHYNLVGSAKWMIRIRYRTLFTLAMIPWIITLIRLIRSWRRKRAADTGNL